MDAYKHLYKPVYPLPVFEEKLQRGGALPYEYTLSKTFLLTREKVVAYIESAVEGEILDVQPISAPRSLCFAVQTEGGKRFVKLFYAKKSPENAYAIANLAYQKMGRGESKLLCVDKKHKLYCSVAEWVEGKPLSVACFEMTEEEKIDCGRALAESLKTLHDLPKYKNTAKISHSGYLKRLRVKMRLAGKTDEQTKALYAFVKKGLKGKERRGVCHTDLHLQNVLCDRDGGRYSLIDTDGLAIGDPWLDFAVLPFCPTALYPVLDTLIKTYFEGEIPKAFWETLAVGASGYALFHLEDERYLKTALALKNSEGYLPPWYNQEK